MSKFVGTGPPSYEKRIYRAVVSRRLRNTELENSVITEQESVLYAILWTVYGSVSQVTFRVFPEYSCRSRLVTYNDTCYKVHCPNGQCN
jgi:hypothetical protein